MQNVVRGLVGLLGVFNIYLASGFLFNTVKTGENFFLTANSIQGIATMRADFTSFFTVAALCALYAAWKNSGQALIIPMLLFGIAITGRFISLGIDGASPTAAMPMIAEAIMIAIAFAGYRILGRTA